MERTEKMLIEEITKELGDELVDPMLYVFADIDYNQLFICLAVGSDWIVVETPENGEAVREEYLYHKYTDFDLLIEKIKYWKSWTEKKFTVTGKFTIFENIDSV